MTGTSIRAAVLDNPPLLLRDSTLREGLECPTVRAEEVAASEIAALVTSLGVQSMEVVAPANFERGLSLLQALTSFSGTSKSGIVGVLSQQRREKLSRLFNAGVDEVDLLLHISEARLSSSFPGTSEFQVRHIEEAFRSAMEDARSASITKVGLGFGDVFRAEPALVSSLTESLSGENPCRFILYDTVGAALPSEVGALIKQLRRVSSTPLHVHFHNDLGMAVANTLVAIENGASGADVTVGGIGDRSGNAPLEVVALVAEKRLGRRTGINLAELTRTCRMVLERFAIPVPACAPVIGPLAFCHSAPSHFAELMGGHNEAYEPYPPETVGQTRRFLIDGSPELEEALVRYLQDRGFSQEGVGCFLAGHHGDIVSEVELKDLLG